MTMERISEHLSVPEFLATRYRPFVLENERAWYDSQVLQAESRRFAATVFEPVRELLGVPLHVTSGYRCPGLNEAVGGKLEPLSHHVLGLAADVIPLGMSVRDAIFAIAHAIRRGELPHIDKAVDEFSGRWLHIQAAEPGDKALRWAMQTVDGDHFARVA
jgi:hypothetical protein